MTRQPPPVVLHGATHSGIPTSTLSEPTGPFVGTLTIGVGTADEPFQQAGITHLAEHLVFRVVEDTAPPADGVTSAHTLAFSVTGSPETVADGLNQVAAVLADPRFDPGDLELERRVVRAENPWHGVHGAGLLTYRFGLGAVGNGHAGAPGTSYLTADEIGSWVSTWATRANARLHFTGPAPADLDVRLPDRPVPARRVSALATVGPTLVESRKEGVALSLLVDPTRAEMLRDVVIHDLIRALRHEQGLIYSVTSEVTVVDDHRAQLDLVLDPVDDDVTRTTEQAVIALRGIARRGISDLALARTRSTWRSDLEATDVWGRYLDSRSAADLRGLCPPPAPPELLRSIDSASVGDLTGALARGLDSLLVAYDSSERLADGLAGRLGLAIDPFDLWQDTAGPPPRRWAASARGTGRDLRSSLGVAGDVLWRRRGRSWTKVDLTTLVLVGVCPDGCLELLDSRGRSTTLDPNDWRRGAAVRAAVLEAIPATIQRDMGLFHR